jgi:hypothetical protein
MKNVTVTLLTLTFVTVSGCDSFVHGNGVFGVETRTVPAFDGVAIGLKGGIAATVTAGSTDRAVTISGDQNVLQYIETRVVDGVLKAELSGTDGFDSVHQVQLVVKAQTLVLAQAWAGASIDVTAIDATSFTVSAAEGSAVTIAGGAGVVGTNLILSASGTSTVDATGYPALSATVTLAGGSPAAVQVTGAVVGSITEGSTLTIHGGGSCGVTLAPGSSCVEVP